MRIACFVGDLLIVLIVGFCSYNAGYSSGQEDIMDRSGRTSIIIEFDNGEECELRGPGRFQALEYFDDARR